MMRRRFLSIFVLFTLLWMSVEPVFAAALDIAEDTMHADGFPCSEGDEENAPCDSNCPCLYCPGHTINVVLLPLATSIDVPAVADMARVAIQADMHANDILNRLYRPPRF